MSPDDTPSELPHADDDVSRRVFVQHLTFMGGGVVLLGGACKEPVPPPPPAPAAPLTTKHHTFTDDEFAVLAAATERILPKDEDVGALDTNVANYIDTVLQTPQLSQMKDQFVPGVPALNRRCQRQFKVDFVKATPAQQDELLTAFKNSGERTGEAKFYEILVVLTLEGFLGDPSYGGNTNKAGWGVVGFSLVQHGPADPSGGYDGMKRLHEMKCGGGKGC
ncbi:MAG: gluconate 2-dehydrogenase subunit 3 family protein [Archangium sp.]|nr:gluconate 2-dehydrogenase subunit 3 family protein [Archangium sp.]